MYQLKSFTDGAVSVMDDAAPYNATFLATTVDEAEAIIVALNLPYYLADLASHRYDVETGGITVAGVVVATDRGSQATLNGAFQALTSGFITSVNWKASSGWASLTLAQITPIATAVANHVQACFTAEMQVQAQISASTTAIDYVSAFDTALVALTTPPA